MDGKDFLKVATALVEGKEEAEYRSAVSRAYYAAYIFALQLLKKWEFSVVDGPGGHLDVQRRFSNCGQIEIKKAASKLDDLRSRRIHADYLKREDIGQQKIAKYWVKIAEDIIIQLETCREDPIRENIIEGIRLYDAKIKGYPK